MIYHVGDQVKKVGGDYEFVGHIVSQFVKRSGEIRYVVEDDRGVLHIFQATNLVRKDIANARGVVA